MKILVDENIPNITLVVRLRQPNEQRIHARIMAAFRQFGEREWPGLLVVMRDTVQSVHRA
jgi:hypothetical protein